MTTPPPPTDPAYDDPLPWPAPLSLLPPSPPRGRRPSSSSAAPTTRRRPPLSPPPSPPTHRARPAAPPTTWWGEDTGLENIMARLGLSNVEGGPVRAEREKKRRLRQDREANHPLLYISLCTLTRHSRHRFSPPLPTNLCRPHHFCPRPPSAAGAGKPRRPPLRRPPLNAAPRWPCAPAVAARNGRGGAWGRGGVEAQYPPHRALRRSTRGSCGCG
jgi:hypothetical protein